MNKKTLFAAMILSSVIANAQDVVGDPTVVKNKKGQDVLPKKGDIALGFDAVPVLNFLVNTVRIGNGSNNTNPANNNVSAFTANSGGSTIVGKYFLTDKTALRVRFGFNSLSTTQTQLVQDSKARFNASLSGNPEEIQAANLLTLEDKRFARNNQLALTAGYEMRRGYRRLVGFYGAELGVSRDASNENFYYANGFSDQYSANYTTAFNNFGTGGTALASVTGPVTRTLETSTPTIWGIGARGFIGIEYFVFAKISISAEYGWGYSYGRRKATTQKQETYSLTSTGAAVVEETIDLRSPSTQRGFAVDNGINSTFNRGISGSTASISLMFHF